LTEVEDPCVWREAHYRDDERQPKKSHRPRVVTRPTGGQAMHAARTPMIVR
jgi:hypothetical protein